MSDTNTNTEKDKEFYTMADAFIDVANKQSGTVESGKVSATFLYAAARFNTYLVAASSDTAEQFTSRKNDAMDYFVAEYKKMLEEHFVDYADNFEKYITTNTK